MKTQLKKNKKVVLTIRKHLLVFDSYNSKV